MEFSHQDIDELTLLVSDPGMVGGSAPSDLLASLQPEADLTKLLGASGNTTGSHIAAAPAPAAAAAAAAAASNVALSAVPLATRQPSAALDELVLSALLSSQDTSTPAETSALSMDELLSMSLERQHPIAAHDGDGFGAESLQASGSNSLASLDLAMLCRGDDDGGGADLVDSVLATPTSSGLSTWNGELGSSAAGENGAVLSDTTDTSDLQPNPTATTAAASSGAALAALSSGSSLSHPINLLTPPPTGGTPPSGAAAASGGPMAGVLPMGATTVSVTWPTNNSAANVPAAKRTLGTGASQISLQQLSRKQITVMYTQPKSASGSSLPHPASTGPQFKTIKLSAQGTAATLAAAKAAALQASASSSTAVDDDSDDDDEYSEANTYAIYKPMKLEIGIEHPDPVVESSSLSGVVPPDIWYSVQLPTEVIDTGKLSALQLEAVSYASQQHWTMLENDSRSGFLIGDGAGVGKGRTIAGIIWENYLQGRRKAIWLSVSSDLRMDAIRDLGDIGADIKVHQLTRLKYTRNTTEPIPRDMRKGVMFGTYSALIGETTGSSNPQRRLDRLIDWCTADSKGESSPEKRENFEGVLVFDECHKAKNLLPKNASKPSKTGQCVLEIQKRLPKARVVYCSATGASEPRHMAYMTRLGIWGKGTQFPGFNDFLSAVEKRGVGGMELVAMDMKLRGMYVARQLSFKGSKFDIVDVPLDPKFKMMYDDSVQLWVKARSSFHTAQQLASLPSRETKTMWAQFWSAHQRFFKYLCIAAKVKHVVNVAQKAIEQNKCVVIGLQSTGEARTLDQIEGKDRTKLDDFISTAKGVVQSLIDKHFPRLDKQEELMFATGKGQKRRNGSYPSQHPDDSLGALGDSQTEESSCASEVDDNDDDYDDDHNNNTYGGGGGTSSSDLDGSASSSPNLSHNRRQQSHRSVGSKAKRKKGAGPSREDLLETQMSNQAALAALGGNSHSAMAWQVGSLLKEHELKNNASSSAGTAAVAAGRTSQSSSRANSRPCSTPSTPSRGGVNGIGASATSGIASSSSGCTGTSSGGLSSRLAAGGKTNGKNKQLQLLEMKEELLAHLEELAPHLPVNTLDELIQELGGSERVAEMTGRRGRVLGMQDGRISYEYRSAEESVSLDQINIMEKDRFMRGEKLVAIISEAASSGISMQADRRVQNQRRRVHITLELPWSADRAIQQFGRTHRSNQTSAPEYLFLISELSGERRFASVVAKRLESLGALTHGDRRATESRDLSRYNYDTKYGRTALEHVMRSVISRSPQLIPVPTSSFYDDISHSLVGVGILQENCKALVDSKDMGNLSRFLNRILGVTVDLQNMLFAYFADMLSAVIARAKRNGRYDEGILDVDFKEAEVNLVSTENFQGSTSVGTVFTELHTVLIERGMTWDSACDLLEGCQNPSEGFYLSKRSQQGRQRVVLVLFRDDGTSKSDKCILYQPNIGLLPKQEKLSSLMEKYFQASDMDIVRKCWQEHYEQSAVGCSHAFMGRCKRKIVGEDCEVGRRKRTYHILSGSVLSVWNEMEKVLQRHAPTSQQKTQIMRVKTGCGRVIIGSYIPNPCVSHLQTVLRKISELHQKASLD
ncbi:protein strawberry notch homolog 1-like isoform X2 [Sycon ciliatum]|uniref:protein strawberry notch homolog 1-like isoform X2 n=1 Tax=Sycon ciliatum TaxID=27933 RepID=UPI0031F62F6F